MYCALMTVTFKHHGGVHEWDLTLPEVWDAIYVSRFHTQSTSLMPNKFLISGSTQLPLYMPQSFSVRN